MTNVAQNYVTDRNKAINAYRFSAVGTASPNQLVLLLYNAVIKTVRDGIGAMEANDVCSANSCLLRAQDIVDELRMSLNGQQGGHIAAHLARVYQFAYDSLLYANIKKDPERARDALAVITELRDGWQELLGRVP